MEVSIVRFLVLLDRISQQILPRSVMDLGNLPHHRIRIRDFELSHISEPILVFKTGMFMEHHAEVHPDLIRHLANGFTHLQVK
jgi:hypothetical protein